MHQRWMRSCVTRLRAREFLNWFQAGNSLLPWRLLCWTPSLLPNCTGRRCSAVLLLVSPRGQLQPASRFVIPNKLGRVVCLCFPVSLLVTLGSTNRDQTKTVRGSCPPLVSLLAGVFNSPLHLQTAQKHHLQKGQERLPVPFPSTWLESLAPNFEQT